MAIKVGQAKERLTVLVLSAQYKKGMVHTSSIQVDQSTVDHYSHLTIIEKNPSPQ